MIMTDLNTLREMFESANIKYEESTEGGRIPSMIEEGGVSRVWATSLSVERGYSLFVTVFYFSADGTLLNMGAWE